MCLRGELGVAIADKTVLKMMREMGIRCGIRRETDRHRYSSYKGVVGKTFENVIGRDFSAAGPWQKLGTDVTEFKQPWGKAYFAPVYDFGSKEESWRGPRRRARAWRSSSPCSTGCWRGCPTGRRRCFTATWAGNTSTPHGAGELMGAPADRPEHVQEGQLHRQRGDRAGLRPHQGRVLPGKRRRRLRVLRSRTWTRTSPIGTRGEGRLS